MEPEPIAIIAMNCRLPGEANNPEKFWQILEDKRDAWTEIPEDRFRGSSFYKSTTGSGESLNFKGAYFLKDDVGKFDPPFFSMTESEAASLDPQQRLQLECAYEAFESASIPLRNLKGSKTAIYTSSFSHDYEDLQLMDPDYLAYYHCTGNKVLAANRLAYFFDFKGPSMALDTACSGSSNALHLAVQSLRNGEADQALVSSCTLMLSPDMMSSMTKMGLFSSEGRSFSFDARASGYGRGEGVACVVLKPLSSALADGNPIRAVIRATASNQNGRSSTITVPSADAQVDVARLAYQACNLDPKDTYYFEAHGTGTPVGDPLECEAIGRLFGNNKRLGTKTIVGSVKANIGHSEPTSGLSSLLKSVLILEKGVIPGQINLLQPNPALQLERWNIRIPTTDEPWMEGMPRRISVNNLGVGGSNAHVIVESLESYYHSIDQQLPSLTRKDLIRSSPKQQEANTQHRLFCLSAMTKVSLKKRLAAFKDYCAAQPEKQFDSLAYTMAKRWEGFTWRWTVVASSMADLVAKLNAAEHDMKEVTTVQKTGFVFAGQGAQWFAMGRELLETYPAFRNVLEAAERILRNLGAEWDLLDELTRVAKDSRVDEAAIGQPLSTAIQLALTELLKSWGVQPHCVIGHSSGEIAAAYATGALSLENALAIAYFRGLHVSSMMRLVKAPQGAMMAVGLSLAEAETEIAGLAEQVPASLVVACVNSPSSVTISGRREYVMMLRDTLKERGISATVLKVEVAYHSSDMSVIADDYLASISSCLPSESSNSAEFWSSVQGSRLKSSDLQPKYWVTNLVSQVKFCQGLSAMASERFDLGLIIEASPHSVLKGPVNQTLAAQNAPVPYTSMLKRNHDAAGTTLLAVKGMLDSGGSVDLEAVINPLLDCETTRLLVDLPQYCWDHSTRYWRQSPVAQRHLQRAYPYHELLGTLSPHATSVDAQWRNIITSSALDWLPDHRVNDDIIFPGAGYMCIAMQAFYQYYSQKNFSPAHPRCLEMRDVSFERGLLLDDSLQVIEMVCHLRPAFRNVRETRTTRYEFEILSSKDGTSWTKHCYGTILAVQHIDPIGAGNRTAIDESGSLLFDRQEGYQRFDNIGFNFGPAFRTLAGGIVNGDKFQGHIKQTQDHGSQQTEQYIIHPTTLDGALQSMIVPVLFNENCKVAMVPTFVGKLVISCEQNFPDILSAESSASFMGTAMSASGSVSTVGEQSKVLMHIDNLSAVVLETELAVEVTEDYGCYETRWITDTSFLEPKGVAEICLRATEGRKPDPADPINVRAALHFFREALVQVPRLEDVKVEHGKYLWEYMRSVVDSSEPTSDVFDVSQFPEDTAQEELIKRMGLALPEILRGTVNPLDLMMQDDLLYRSYTAPWFDYHNDQLAAYIRALAYKNPALKILEIGAGTGGTTQVILRQLPVRRGFSFDFTDISSGFFPKAQELFQQWASSINYRKLDIEKDPIDQAFDAGTYDVIIASNVLHATKNIRRTLQNTKTLLEPGGHLMLLEATTPAPYTHLVYGCLPGWWLGIEDARDSGPCLQGSAWLSHLQDIGFTSTLCLPDPSIDATNVVSNIIARLDDKSPSQLTDLSFAILPDLGLNLVDPVQLQNLLKESLSSPCEIVDWNHTVSSNQICILIGADASSRLTSGDEERFKPLQSVISDSSGSIVLTSRQIDDGGFSRSALFTGLFRTIRCEANSMRFSVIDVESPSDVHLVSKVIARNLLHDFNEVEVAIRDNRVLAPRIVPEPIVNQFLSTGDLEDSISLKRSDFAVKLDFRTPGYLESLRFVPDDSVLPDIAPNKIEIAVKAVGLNFRHVLYAIGKFSAAEYAKSPAGECSGIITAVGSDVQDKFNVGDRVTATGVFNAFTTVVQIPAALARRIPDSMDFITAAQFPLTYVTAWFSLVNMARIRNGDNVLIHSGTGGVGQAAITMAQHFKANVFVTCGSDEKKAFLKAEYGIPEANIFSSKNFDFVDAIMGLTGGKGVDIILNSLSGEFITESCRCLAHFGRFIEIGKKDIHRRSKLDMGIFTKSTSFMALDLSHNYQGNADQIGDLIQEVMDMLSSGALKLVSPVHVERFDKCAAAFRYMSSGRHIGKVVLSLEDLSELKVTIPDYGKSSSRSSGTYIVVGGLGGLGREICLHIAKRYEGAHVVVLSRTKSFTNLRKAQDLEVALAGHGAELHCMTCDVADKEQVRLTIDECKKTLPPIRGVIQGAMVLRDSSFETMTAEQFRSVILPKVYGTQYLVDNLPPRNLDFFIMLSSVCGIVGGLGQGNYAAASGFQDSYARHMTSVGEPTTCLDLGWIQGAGYVEETEGASSHVAKHGLKPVPIDVLLRALSYAMKRKPQTPEQSQIIIGLSNTIAFQAGHGARFALLQAEQFQSAKDSSNGALQTLSAQQFLQSCKSYQDAVDFITARIIEKLSLLLAVPLSKIQSTGSLADYGMDSLVSIEMKNWVRQELACNLGTLEILSSKSIGDLGVLVSQKSRYLSETTFHDVSAAANDEDTRGRSEKRPSSRDSGLGTDKSLTPPRKHNKLPILPVPSLEATVTALLDSLRVLVPKEEYEQAEQGVKQFLLPSGTGTTLQQRLLDYAETTVNWHTDLWFQKQYIENSAPVAPFTNYFGLYEPTTVSSASEVAACICDAVLDFRQKLDQEPDDSILFRSMLHSCRVPQKPKDTTVAFDKDLHPHFVIIRNGHFFKLNFICDGVRLSKAEIKASIESIYRTDASPVVAIGALTTLDRNSWAEVRQSLIEVGPQSKRALEDIESACFVLCLDSEQPSSITERAKRVWFGDGTNRWFDKPLQLVVFDDGQAGAVHEHSAVDGLAAKQMNDYIEEYMRQASGKITSTTSMNTLRNQVTEIQFTSTDLIVKATDKARSQFQQTISQENIAASAYTRFGALQLSYGMRNANACVQLMLNLASYRMLGRLLPNYEPVALTAFAEGRFTTCSMAIPEVLTFCQVTTDPKTSHEDRHFALLDALKAHAKNVTASIIGSLNTEAHLTALKSMLRADEAIPDIFTSPSVQKCHEWDLSASCLPSKFDLHYGCWQVTEAGIAIGHMIRDDRLDFMFFSSHLDCEKFATHVLQAAEDVGKILDIIT